MVATAMNETIRNIVIEHARLSAKPEDVSATTDLYAAGLTSLTTVHVMLALEDEFDVEFPDHMLTRQTFDSIQSIADAIEELVE